MNEDISFVKPGAILALIRAAPDLYKALRDLLNLLDPEFRSTWPDFIKQAEDALKKAKGE